MGEVAIPSTFLGTLGGQSPSTISKNLGDYGESHGSQNKGAWNFELRLE